MLTLLMAWSYLHKHYETDSTLSRNFLLIAPNIIVLDRLRIFFNDPILPGNGHFGRNWRDDFQVALDIQDDVRVVRPVGKIFLTNIHRVYVGEVPEPSLDDDDLRDYFCGHGDEGLNSSITRRVGFRDRGAGRRATVEAPQFD